MITIATILILIYLFYILFVKGVGFAIALVIGGTLGLSLLIKNYYPQSVATCATIMSYNISFANAIAFVICVVGCGYFMENKSITPD
jgi:hypothetical protein